MLTPEQIQDNLQKFYQVIESHVSEPRTTKLLSLYQSQEENLALAPASSRAAFHNSFPGGYVDHVLRVVEASIRMYDLWAEMGISTDTFKIGRAHV